jgi:hypothetical protein
MLQKSESMDPQNSGSILQAGSYTQHCHDELTVLPLWDPVQSTAGSVQLRQEATDARIPTLRGIHGGLHAQQGWASFAFFGRWASVGLTGWHTSRPENGRKQLVKHLSCFHFHIF